MGKNKRNQIEHFDEFHNVKVLCDSNEEVDMFNWLSEAAQLGIVIDYAYQPISYKLFEAEDYMNVEGKKRCLFREHVYSPDFSIKFNPSKFQQLAKEFKLSKSQAENQEFEVYIDVKGMFAKNDGGRSFSINQKWMYQKYKLYVYKLVPKEFFAKFGCPQASFYTVKTKKARKIFSGCKSIQLVFLKKMANHQET